MYKNHSIKRLVKEYTNFNYIELNLKNFEYKIVNIENNINNYIVYINFEYKNKNYVVNIIYKNNYPFNPPSNITLNRENFKIIYREIMKNNSDIIKNCLCCDSFLCNNKWSCCVTINDLIKEVLLVIYYKKLYIKRIILNQIIKKYTNQNMNYLHYYLLI
jgi:ubiquitin-protein ligase